MSDILSCSQCNKQFKTIRGYDHHVYNNICHDQIKKVTCIKCHKIFSSTRKLKYHNDNVICVQKIKLKLKINSKSFDISSKKQHTLDETSEF